MAKLKNAARLHCDGPMFLMGQLHRLIALVDRENAAVGRLQQRHPVIKGVVVAGMLAKGNGALVKTFAVGGQAINAPEQDSALLS